MTLSPSLLRALILLPALLVAWQSIKGKLTGKSPWQDYDESVQMASDATVDAELG